MNINEDKTYVVEMWQAIEAMPETFTSNEVKDKFLEITKADWNVKLSNQLLEINKRNCEHVSRKTWRKKNGKEVTEPLSSPVQLDLEQEAKKVDPLDGDKAWIDDFEPRFASAIDLKNAIALLKRNGYKVMKPKTQYEEV